jgi:hypothetical protein
MKKEKLPYRLPRLKAIRTIIAGPAVITRKRDTSCAKVCRLGIIR